MVLPASASPSDCNLSATVMSRRAQPKEIVVGELGILAWPGVVTVERLYQDSSRDEHGVIMRFVLQYVCSDMAPHHQIICSSSLPGYDKGRSCKLDDEELAAMADAARANSRHRTMSSSKAASPPAPMPLL